MMIVERIRNSAGANYAVLGYEPAGNYLLMQWIGFATAEEVQTASLRMLAWQQTEGLRRNCRFQVHDTKEMECAWMGLVDWINHDFLPRNYTFGLRYNLSILSPDMFSKMSSLELQQQGRHMPVPTFVFETLAQAEAWMAQNS